MSSWIRQRNVERVRLGRASGRPNMPHWIRNDIIHLQREIFMKILVENGKICNQPTMGERLERIGKVWIVDKMDCFRLDFVKKMKRRFSCTTPDM